MNRDEKVSKMANILLAGGKMLSSHCPKCGSPMFEFRGKTLCPICSEEEVTTEEKPKEKIEPVKKPSIDRIENILLKKLDELADQLEKEASPRSMSEILNLMKSTLEVLERIRKG